jgi:hypothetical protein
MWPVTIPTPPHTTGRRTEVSDEPDYEYVHESREEARAERNLHRLDNLHGRVEDHRKKDQP